MQYAFWGERGCRSTRSFRCPYYLWGKRWFISVHQISRNREDVWFRRLGYDFLAGEEGRAQVDGFAVPLRETHSSGRFHQGTIWDLGQERQQRKATSTKSTRYPTPPAFKIPLTFIKAPSKLSQGIVVLLALEMLKHIRTKFPT